MKAHRQPQQHPQRRLKLTQGSAQSATSRGALTPLSVVARAALASLALQGCDSAQEQGTSTAGVEQLITAEPTAPPLSEEDWLRPETCQGCHPQHYEQWAASMHAYAADDPVFLAMNQRAQRETEGELGDFCVQCHAPIAHRLGLSADGLNLGELPQHLKGVTCAFCHQIESVRGAHNNPLEWVNDGVMRGSIKSPAEGSPHRSRYSPLLDREQLDSSALCGACHDVLTPKGVHLERTSLEWRQGLFNSPDPRYKNTCNDCHMPTRTGAVSAVEGAPIRRVSDHLMPGLDVHLTPHPGRERMEEAVRAELRMSLLPELCVAVGESGGAEVELYLENIAAGHRFPSGASLDRRVWVELSAYDDAGELLWASGRVEPDEPVAYQEARLEGDPSAPWLMRDVAYDERGDETHLFWEVDHLEPRTLPGPQRVGVGEPGYEEPHVLKRYRFGTSRAVRSLELRVWARPMGLEVLEALIESGDLSAEVPSLMPTFELEGAARRWRAEEASPTVTLSGRELLCVP